MCGLDAFLIQARDHAEWTCSSGSSRRSVSFCSARQCGSCNHSTASQPCEQKSLLGCTSSIVIALRCATRSVRRTCRTASDTTPSRSPPKPTPLDSPRSTLLADRLPAVAPHASTENIAFVVTSAFLKRNLVIGVCLLVADYRSAVFALESIA